VPRSSRVRSVIAPNRLANVEKHTLSELNEALRGRCHAHLPGPREKERLAKLFFEQQNLTADRGLRHVQLAAARGERAGLGDCLEISSWRRIHDGGQNRWLGG